MRERCWRCRRPKTVCYCAKLPSIATQTRVILLQHFRERDMPIGTARMAKLCLPNSELHVGLRWDESVIPPGAILLYPGEGAKDILVEPPPQPVTLVVVDGTWSQAKRLVRDNPILHELPRYAFVAPELSRYRIRKEPRDEYCSTIEALMHVLGALEGDPATFRSMLVPFEAMIDAQMAAEASAPKRQYRQVIRGKRSPMIPAMITDALARWDDLVCIVAEANAWPYRTDGTVHQPDELVHLLACRPSDGSRYEAIIAPRGDLSTSTPFHLKLAPSELHAGISLSAAIAGFTAFLRPNDIACTWGHFGASLLGDFSIPKPRFDMREAARKRVNRATPHIRVGALEAYAPSSKAIGTGRGGERLGMLVEILRSWRG